MDYGAVCPTKRYLTIFFCRGSRSVTVTPNNNPPIMESKEANALTWALAQTTSINHERVAQVGPWKGITCSAVPFLDDFDPATHSTSSFFNGSNVFDNSVLAMQHDSPSPPCTHRFAKGFDPTKCADCGELLPPHRVKEEQQWLSVVREEDNAIPAEEHDRALHARGVSVQFLIEFTRKHNCWDKKTWWVNKNIIKPATELLRCRYTDLPEIQQANLEEADGLIGPASVFLSHCWGAMVGCYHFPFVPFPMNVPLTTQHHSRSLSLSPSLPLSFFNCNNNYNNSGEMPSSPLSLVPDAIE